MNVVFLDIDDVIHVTGDNLLCPVRLGLVKQICDTAKASVVLSSAWRLVPRDLDHVIKVFKGWDIPFAGVTPDFCAQHKGRIDEILDWIDKNKPDNWVAIDDFDLFEGSQDHDNDVRLMVYDHFIMVGKFGLEKHHAEKAVEVLLNQPGFKFWNAFDEAKQQGAKL
jgi:hypothetical protein